jgi:hypothetical protein
MRSPSPPNRLWWYAALALAVLVRVALLADKPFWRDEAWVATLIETPLADTLAGRPRPVPIGFLALTQLTRALPFTPEVSYRLVPLLCGVALVPLLASFAAALGASGAVPLVTMWLAAALPALVYYSRELKSYGIDALLAVVVPLLALHLFERASGACRLAPHRAGATLCGVLLLAPWFSFGGQFAIGALLLWGWLVWWRGAAPSARRWWLAGSLAYAASLALIYRLALAAQSTSPTLRSFWTDFRFSDTSGSFAAQVADALWRFVTLLLNYVSPAAWWVTLPLIVLGGLTWARDGRRLLLWLLVVPGLAAVAAALADRYLLAQGRLLLFDAPPVILLAAAGLTALAQRLWPARRDGLALAASAAVALLLSTAAIARRTPAYMNRGEYFRYDIIHDVDPLIDAVGKQAAADEPIYVAQYAGKACNYYGRGRLARATGCPEPCDVRRSVEEWARSLHGRGWLIVTQDEETLVAASLKSVGASYSVAVPARGAALWAVQPAG